MNLKQLRELAKEAGIKNISKLKKSELFEVLKNIKPISLEKDGVILSEKISVKKVDTQLNNIQQAKAENTIIGIEDKPEPIKH